MKRREFLRVAATLGIGAALHAFFSRFAGSVILAGQTCCSKKSKPGYSWLWDEPRAPEHAVIFRPPVDYDANRNAQVPNVHLLKNGDLAVDFIYDIPLSDAVQIDPKRPIYISSDGGRKWAPSTDIPKGLYLDPVSNISKIKPAMLHDGSLLMMKGYGWQNFPTDRKEEFLRQGYKVWVDGTTPDIVSISHGAWKSISKDNGKTWQKSDIKLPRFISLLHVYNSEGIVLKDGTFLASAYGCSDINDDPYGSCFVLRRRNEGNWDIQTMAKSTKPEHGFCEPGLAEAANGDVVSMMRTSGQRELWTTISSDAGKTWAKPWDSGLRGSTPWLLTTTDGLLVALFGRRTYRDFPKTGIWFGVSRDNGRSWKQYMLLDRGIELVPAQGTAAALPDGSVYYVYSFAYGIAIGGTRFHPDFF